MLAGKHSSVSIHPVYLAEALQEEAKHIELVMMFLMMYLSIE